MLRRCVLPSSRGLVPLSATARWSSSTSSSSSDAAARNARQDELDREARLRQQIAQKQKDLKEKGFFNTFMQSSPGMSTTEWPTMKGPNGQRVSFGSMLWSALIYTTAFYCLVMTYQMRQSEQSYFASMQGMPKFATPAEVTACYLAVRTLLGVNKQRELQTDYERYKQIHPTANFYHFLMAEKPTALAGRTVTQSEFVAAMVSAYNGAGSMKWTKAITNVSRWTDDQARIDAAVENLRRDYPNVVAQASAGAPIGFAAPYAPSYSYGSAPQWAAQQAVWAPHQGGTHHGGTTSHSPVQSQPSQSEPSTKVEEPKSA